MCAVSDAYMSAPLFLVVSIGKTQQPILLLLLNVQEKSCDLILHRICMWCRGTAQDLLKQNIVLPSRQVSLVLHSYLGLV